MSNYTWDQMPIQKMDWSDIIQAAREGRILVAFHPHERVVPNFDLIRVEPHDTPEDIFIGRCALDK